MNNDELMTVEETARFLRVAPNTVYRWIKDGTVLPLRIGGSIRFNKTDLIQALK